MNAISDERLGCVSASSVERYWNCAGARQLEKQVERQSVKPVEKDSAAAASGTLLHSANESGDVSDLEMSEAAAVQKIRESEEQICRAWCADNNLEFSKVTVIREKRFFHTFPNGRSVTAKIDTLVLVDGFDGLLISDAKSGRLRVTPPVRNQQLRVCALLAAVEYKKTSARVAIANLWGRQDPPCDYTADDLLAIEKLLAARLELIEQPDQPRTVSHACEFCSAAHICPERREQAGALIRQRTINWDLVLPEQKKALWEMADLAGKVAIAIKTQLKADLANDPDSCPGLGKRPDGETRTISNVAGAYAILKQLFPASVTDERFLKQCSISLGGFKELYSEIAGGGDKEAEQFIADKLGPDIVGKSPRSGAVFVKKD